MVRVFFTALVLFATCACALDRLWDTRYTFGPEFLTRDRFTVGTGFYTAFIEDGTVPVNTQIALSDYLECGGKLFFTTQDDLETVHAFADIGAKYRVQEYATVEADILVGINNSEGGGLVFLLCAASAPLQKFLKPHRGPHRLLRRRHRG